MKNITIINLIKDSFKKSLDIYQKNWKAIVPVAILFFAVQYPSLTISEQFKVTSTETDLEKAIMSVSISSVAHIITMFIVILMDIGIVFIGKKIYDEKKFDFTEMFKHRDRYWNYFWLNIKTGFFIMIGLIFFIIPGVIMAIKYSLAPYIFLLNGKGVKESMDLSVKYTEGIKMKLFGFYIVLIFMYAFLGTIPLFGPLVIAPIAFLMHMYVFLEIDKEMTMN